MIKVGDLVRILVDCPPGTTYKLPKNDDGEIIGTIIDIISGGAEIDVDGNWSFWDYEFCPYTHCKMDDGNELEEAHLGEEIIRELER